MKTFAILGSLFVVGCGTSDPAYKNSAFTDVSISELPGSVSAQQISVPVGSLVTARVVATDTEGARMMVSFESEDVSVLAVEPLQAADKFAFIGAKRGSTIVREFANGELVNVIRAYVPEQVAGR